MFSKQLIIGLVLGALCMGLGIMMFAGPGVSMPAVSDQGNLKLLAQVVPNEPVSDREDIESSSTEIIEVRTSLPAAKSLSKAAVEVFVEEDVIEEIEPEIVLCAYATDDEPERDGIISEVAWMGSGDDANAEWVEMQNRTKTDLDVSGWQLVDKAQQIQAIVPVGVVLSKSGFLLFERDKHQLPGTTVLYKGALGNTDEGLRLFDANCDLQDEIVAKSKWPAGTNSPKHTAERAKDLSWHTFYGDDDAGIFGTPGKKNSSGPPPEPEPKEEPESEPEQPAEEPDEPEPEVPVVVPVVAGQLIISEVMAGDSDGAGNEFIELYNTTNDEIDLTGFSIKKKVLSSGSESSLVTTVNFEGKKVAAGQRFIIGHGSYVAQTQMTWPASYSVAYTGNAALLYNAQGEEIDEVSWELSAGQSYACASQGSCAVQETPNPGE